MPCLALWWAVGLGTFFARMQWLNPVSHPVAVAACSKLALTLEWDAHIWGVRGQGVRARKKGIRTQGQGLESRLRGSRGGANATTSQSCSYSGLAGSLTLSPWRLRLVKVGNSIAANDFLIGGDATDKLPVRASMGVKTVSRWTTQRVGIDLSVTTLVQHRCRVFVQ